MTFIGGRWQQMHIVVDVLTPDGFTQAICVLNDVPFGGDWNRETNDVSVGCLWSPRELKANLEATQQWGDTIVTQSIEEQEQLINERLNILVKEEPWNWIPSE